MADCLPELSGSNLIRKTNLVINNSGFRRKVRVIKCKPFLVPGVRGRARNWGGDSDRGDSDSLCYHICSLFMNNMIYRMLCFVKKVLERITPYTVISCHIQRCQSFSERVGPQIILSESLPNEQSTR